MIGAFLGFILFLILSLCGVTDYWWLLWGSLIGLVAEFSIRLGIEEEVAVAAIAVLDIIGVIGDVLSCFGDSGGD